MKEVFIIDACGIRCSTTTNVGVLDHFPDIAEALLARDWTSVDTALKHIASHEGVWTATGNEVIDWYESCSRAASSLCSYLHRGKRPPQLLSPSHPDATGKTSFRA